MKKVMTALVLSLNFGLMGCYALQVDQSEQPEIFPLFDDFAECFGVGDKNKCERSASYPFYVDGRALNQVEFYQVLPSKTRKQLPGYTLKYRVLPLQDMEVFLPRIWDRIQQQDNFAQERTNLFLLALNIQAFGNDPETGWMLLRQTPQGLRMAGLIDR